MDNITRSAYQEAARLIRGRVTHHLTVTFPATVRDLQPVNHNQWVVRLQQLESVFAECRELLHLATRLEDESGQEERE